MEQKSGYKQTEVGIIPETWDVASIGSLIFDYRGGASLRPSDFTRTGVKVLPKGGVGRTGWLNVEESEQKYCSPEYAAANYRNQVDETYTIIVLRDLVPSGPSIGLIVRIRDRETYVLAQGVYGFKVNEKAIPAYLVHLSNTSWYRKLANSMMVGSTQVHITNTAYKKALIPLPSTAEQEAIAEALSDADALIEAMEQLLAKKRQVKQGAISELLTGKRRLSGFEKKSGYKQTEVGIIPEDWDAVSILEICDDKKGSIKIGPFGSQLKREYLVSSGYKVYGQENVYAQDVEIGDRYLTKEHFIRLKSCELLSGDFIVSMMGTIGQCMIVPDGIQQGIIDSHLIRIRLNPKVVVPTYMSYYYSSKLVFDQISRLQVGGIMAGLSSSVIKQIYIGLPNSTKEQTAIAEILSDMDAEISALEEKLVKARQVKAGMMSELLTGKIRLV
jgi:type I restriction enzyme S subunit